ncbi:PLP-dependent aminotransferase family protein [Streptomyces sp. INA 01156]
MPAEQVIVVSGAQQAIDLATRVLVDEGEEVWMEDPGYGGARSAFQAAGATVVPVPVDQDGLVVSTGVTRAPHARMAYVTPSHQYPLGHPMTMSRRRELLKWATTNNSWIVEDDYDSEFRYSGRPQPALQGMSDGGNRVIYVGTFSKVLFPSLRLGYMVVPDELVDAFLVARSLSDRHQSTLDQAVLTDFITDGHFMRHIRRSRVAYAERQDCMLDRLAHETPGFIRAAPDPAGMSLVGWLPPMSLTCICRRGSRQRGSTPRHCPTSPWSRSPKGRSCSATPDSRHLASSSTPGSWARRCARSLATVAPLLRGPARLWPSRPQPTIPVRPLPPSHDSGENLDHRAEAVGMPHL